jgi:Xaa-Pro aminopeptidase
VEFVDASESIRQLRMIKSPYEAGQIRAAAQMLEHTFTRVPGWISPGMTELELSACVETFLRLQGHPGITRMRAFNCEIAYGVIAGGPSASYPTGFPGPVGSVGLYSAIPSGAGRRKIASGDSLMVDIVGGYGGYIADETRTFSLGELPRDMREGHDFAVTILREMESMLKPGIACKRLYRHALELAKDSPHGSTFMGAGENQVRFVGHGVGLELDDLPVLAAGFDGLLQEGMTIAIEPKIFFPDERGGVGVENTYLITATGFENLTPSPLQLITVQ